MSLRYCIRGTYFTRQGIPLSVLFGGNKRRLNTSSISHQKIAIGEKADLVKTFSSQDVLHFSEICEDRNPLHIDENFANTTRYGRCIVHGVLINSLTSAVMGMKLPGQGSIFMSQEITFHAPLFVGEPVKAEVEIVKIERRKVTCALKCTALDRDEVVMSGTAFVLAPKPRIEEKRDS